MTECPKCRVPINLFSMQCPNCNLKVSATEKPVARVVESSPSRLTVFPTTELPPFCHQCDSPTNLDKKISGIDESHFGHRDDEESPIPWSIVVRLVALPVIIAAIYLLGIPGIILSFILVLILIFVRILQNRVPDYEMAVKVPTCKECRKYTYV